MNQAPYIGATVHYWYPHKTPLAKPRAAIICDVHDNEWVALFVIGHGGGTRYTSHVERGVGWDWPPGPDTSPAPSMPHNWNGI